MSALYVVEHGAIIRKRGEELVVEKQGHELIEVELGSLASVVIMSSVQVTTQAMAAMLSRGTELAIVNSHGRLLGQLTPPLARNLSIRRAQFEKERDPEFALEQSRFILAAKIENQRQVLVRFSSDRPGSLPKVEKAIPLIRSAAHRLAQADRMDLLLGIEGQCAALYWSAFGELFIPGNVSFRRRRAHPPPDPVNAALSFGYALLTNLLASQLDARGFDPFLGFLHQEVYGRPSLALDLMEGFRAPVVDRMVVRMFNLRMLTPEDFSPAEGEGVKMCEDAVRAFFKEWERTLSALQIREAIRGQINQLARVFRGQDAEVSPWRWYAR